MSQQCPLGSQASPTQKASLLVPESPVMSDPDSPMLPEDEESEVSQSDDKESFGSSPSPVLMTQRVRLREGCSPTGCAGHVVRKRRERTQATNTIKSAWHSARRNLSSQFKESLEEEFMPSSPEVPRLKPIAPKSLLELENRLNLE